MLLQHSGIKGMKWGARNGPPYPIESKYKTTNEMLQDMKTFSYKEYTKLQSPEKTARTRSGSCHDQVIYEAQELQRMGYKPETTFIFEHDGNGQGGMTHSLVHYKTGGKEHWFENAWQEQAGDKIYNSLEDIYKEITMAHKTGEYGNKKKYPYLEIQEFDWTKHEPGEDLQEWVNRCFKYYK